LAGPLRQLPQFGFKLLRYVLVALKMLGDGFKAARIPAKPE
jgi:hypothetical protein